MDVFIIPKKNSSLIFREMKGEGERTINVGGNIDQLPSAWPYGGSSPQPQHAP